MLAHPVDALLYARIPRILPAMEEDDFRTLGKAATGTGFNVYPKAEDTIVSRPLRLIWSQTRSDPGLVGT